MKCAKLEIPDNAYNKHTDTPTGIQGIYSPIVRALRIALAMLRCFLMQISGKDTLESVTMVMYT